MSNPRTHIPVLMYHKVGQPVATAEDRFLNVAESDFARQMRVLDRLGYKARSFAEVVDAHVSRKTLPKRSFAVTFDDGYACVGQFAAPILAAHAFPATVFVVPSGVGKENSWDEATGRQRLPLMDWDSLLALQRAGWEIAGHTRSHPHLDALEDAEAYEEIHTGKAETENRSGMQLTTFCYPFGHFNARTPEIVRSAGFAGACTTRSGVICPEMDAFLLPRVKVAYSDGVAGLFYRLLVRPYLPDLRRGRRSQRAGKA